ncbi:hypothetical protein [Nodularia sp. NIES-3585]|uniref:hypothetical protein n=1 Tax=Nodularia sp. NIES-3585 TaxID=1973477 RepID=UPI000B67DB95|nr:hypothetical protein [Nodularia sp. NIES-3585]GAX37370.1 hypothetical protein NIES3585_34130 [Nodularia sp. NIES-3585]
MSGRLKFSVGIRIALEQITARAKIEALARSIETLNQGLKDLLEETSKYKK